MQQWLQYLAILADRLVNSQGVVAKEVRLGLKSVKILLKPFVVVLFQGALREGDGSLPQALKGL